MENTLYEKLKETALSEMTTAQRLDLMAALRSRMQAETAKVVVARREVELGGARKCPHCGVSRYYGHGKDRRGFQRFRCEGCGKTGNALQGTGLARLRHPEKWLPFAEMLAQRKSLADTAGALGINRKTALHWRRTFLAAPMAHQAAGLSGVIEADETFFHNSFKGSRAWKNGAAPTLRMPRYSGAGEANPGGANLVPVMTAKDRGGALVEGVMPDRTLASMAAVLDGKIGQGSVVCTDKNRAYKKIVEAAGSEWRVITSGKKKGWLAKALGGRPRRKGRFGLGLINNHHQNLKTEINRGFRGVSTLYLPMYLGLLRIIDKPGFKPEDFLTMAGKLRKQA